MAQDPLDLQAIQNLFNVGAKPSPVTGIASPEFQQYSNAILAALQPEFQRQRQGLSDQFRITGGAGSRSGGAYPRELTDLSGRQTTLASEAVLRNAIPYLESQRLAGESALDRERLSNATVLGRGATARPQELDINQEANRQLQRDLVNQQIASRPDQPGRFEPIVNELLRSLISGVPTIAAADLLKPNSWLRSTLSSLLGIAPGAIGATQTLSNVDQNLGLNTQSQMPSTPGTDINTLMDYLGVGGGGEAQPWGDFWQSFQGGGNDIPDVSGWDFGSWDSGGGDWSW